MFHVPNQYRLRAHPVLGTNDSVGNNGFFTVPHQSFELRCIASDGAGWEHVSVSLGHRIPNWEEMKLVKALFWDEEDVVVEYHPAKSHYINYHPRTLHLWRPTHRIMPTPPDFLVAPANVSEKKAGVVLQVAVRELLESVGFLRSVFAMVIAQPDNDPTKNKISIISQADRESTMSLLAMALERIMKGDKDAVDPAGQAANSNLT